MNDALLKQEAEVQSKFTSYLETLFDKAEDILQKHRHDNPDLYKMIQEQKIIKEEKEKNKLIALSMPSKLIEHAAVPALTESIYFKQFKQEQLKTKIAVNQQLIHEQHVATHSLIVPRRQARNVKKEQCSIQEMTDDRADKLSAQVQAWRRVLPILIGRFSKIPDPRRARSVKHKLCVVMLYGLFAFIFRLSSRREVNRELSGTVIFENLKKLFPELGVPQGTLSRKKTQGCSNMDGKCKASLNDEGRSFEIGFQEQISNHLKLLLSKAMVVSVEEKVKLIHQVWIRKTNYPEPLLTRREETYMASKPRSLISFGINQQAT